VGNHAVSDFFGLNLAKFFNGPDKAPRHDDQKRVWKCGFVFFSYFDKPRHDGVHSFLC
jgi:hypothetical protein